MLLICFIFYKIQVIKSVNCIPIISFLKAWNCSKPHRSNNVCVIRVALAVLRELVFDLRREPYPSLGLSYKALRLREGG